ncbi:uncharacterized protein LOC107616434 [Arachis ipaensis]|uniref:uncharacterized protein LOC107616434 n=1 Tax=Arachis ipaensis TaxID=130454 RepID=UPI0007AF98C6|nr:uncharacterized protein LOC107616434 [Arachis ipaensis]
MAVVVVEIPMVADGEFAVGMEFSSRENVIMAMKDYIIRRGVDYRVYELEPLTFYAKCTQYGSGCNWLIRVSMISRKYCWVIRRYNGNHTCTRATISQDHSKLDSNTTAEAIKSLVEADPSIKVKSVIAEVQSKFNYTISYRKAWLAKQKSVEKIFGVSQDGNNNIVPIVEGETSDAWHFFLSNLRQHVVTRDGVGLIYDQHESINADIRGRFASTKCTTSVYENGARLTLTGQTESPREQYALAFDGGYRWGHMTTNLVECINSVLKGAHNIPMHLSKQHSTGLTSCSPEKEPRRRRG